MPSTLHALMNGFVEATISVHCARAYCATMQVDVVFGNKHGEPLSTVLLDKSIKLDGCETEEEQEEETATKRRFISNNLISLLVATSGKLPT
jgi:hypothetical protein